MGHLVIISHKISPKARIITWVRSLMWIWTMIKNIVEKITMSISSNNTKNSGNNASNTSITGSGNNFTQASVVNNSHFYNTPPPESRPIEDINKDSKEALSDMMAKFIERPSTETTGSLILDDAKAKLIKLNIDLVKILALSFMFSIKKTMTYKTPEFLYREFGMVIAHFKDLKITHMELRYLESVGCGKYDKFSRGIWRNVITFDPKISIEDLLANIPDFQVIQNIMDRELSSFSPSPTGIAIAIEYLNRNGFTMDIKDWIGGLTPAKESLV